MTYLSGILSLISLVQKAISWLSERQLLDAGAKAQLSDSLLNVLGMVADAKKISEWVAKQPDDVITSILQRHYTRD